MKDGNHSERKVKLVNRILWPPLCVYANILNAFLYNIKDISHTIPSVQEPQLSHALSCTWSLFFFCWDFYSHLSLPSLLFGVFVFFFPRDMLVNSEFPALSALNQKWWLCSCIQSRAEELNCQFWRIDTFCNPSSCEGIGGGLICLEMAGPL